MRRDIERRLQALEQAFQKQGAIFTLRMKDGGTIKADVFGAVIAVRDKTADEIQIDNMIKGSGQLVELMNDLLRE